MDSQRIAYQLARTRVVALPRWWNKLRRRYSHVQVVRVDRKWHRSEFPHPLVTLDFDEKDVLIGVSVLGRDMKVVSE